MTLTNHLLTTAAAVVVGVIVGLGSALMVKERPPEEAVVPVPPSESAAALSAQQERLSDLISELQALRSEAATLLSAVSSGALRSRQPVDGGRLDDERILKGIDECSKRVAELANTLAATLPVLSQLEPDSNQVPNRPPVSLGVLQGKRSEELTEKLRMRTFEEIFNQLGSPGSMFPIGNTIAWEYRHADGSLLGMRFVNGRVVSAWD